MDSVYERPRSSFVAALDEFLALAGDDTADPVAVLSAQQRAAEAFRVLRDRVIESSGWSLSLGDEQQEPEEEELPVVGGSRADRVIRIEVRAVRPKKLRKLLTEHLRGADFSRADLARMTWDDLLGEVVHELTSRLAGIVQDGAGMTVTVRRG